MISEYNSFRLQLTVRPEQDNNVSLDFNYHSNVSGADTLSERLGCFIEVTKHARNIAIKLLGGEDIVTK